MLKVKRFILAATVIATSGLISACVTAPTASVAPNESMSRIEMDQLVANAEQAITMNNLVSAIAMYKRVLTAHPDNASAWFRLGTVYIRSNQTILAQQAFEQALRADPNMTKAFANLALVHITQFRAAATAAINSDQVSEANRAALKSLLRDVDHTMSPVVSTPAAVSK